MLNISNALIEKLSIWKQDRIDTDSKYKMDVHLVGQNDIFYKKGRQLANQVYNHWFFFQYLKKDIKYFENALPNGVTLKLLQFSDIALRRMHEDDAFKIIFLKTCGDFGLTMPAFSVETVPL